MTLNVVALARLGPAGFVTVSLLLVAPSGIFPVIFVAVVVRFVRDAPPIAAPVA